MLLKSSLIALSLALTSVGSAQATQRFDFKDPKGVNNVVFLLDAPLESINGTADGISGNISFDPADPTAIKGSIIVETASLHVPNASMKEHLHGPKWMDSENHPEMVFSIKSATLKESLSETRHHLLVTGDMTVRGVTREMTITADVNYLKDRLAARGGGMEGDLLVVRSRFNLSRSEFGINAGNNEDKVANNIEITLSLAGVDPR